jgi:hypothetical protein
MTGGQTVLDHADAIRIHKGLVARETNVDRAAENAEPRAKSMVEADRAARLGERRSHLEGMRIGQQRTRGDHGSFVARSSATMREIPRG